MFGGTVPEQVTQDQETGDNDLKTATAVSMGIPFEMNGYHLFTITAFEAKMEELATELNQKFEHI